MKGKFEKFFEAQQEKGAFEGLKFEDLNEEQSQELHALYLDELDAEMKKAKEKADKAEGSNEELKQQLNDLSNEIAKRNAEYSALNLKLANATTKSFIEHTADSPNARRQQAIKEAKEFHKKFVEAMKSGKDEQFTIKADTLTTSVSNFTRGVEDPTVTRLAHRRLTAYEAIPSKPRIPANAGGTYRYLDQDSGTSVRAAAQVAEGAASPESTIAWVKRSIDLKKTSDHLPYSDEFEYDFQNLMVELVAFLRDNVDIEVDDQIINGDGTGENYDGMLTSIPAYTPVASGITDANIFDLMCVVAEDITDGEGSKYQPDLVFMNSADIVSINYLLKKDTDNNYMRLQEMAEMKGFRVIENNSLAANTMILGDSRYAHIPEDGLVTVKTGLYSGTDAIDGIQRVLVQTRKNLLIKNLEQTGWREVTSISSALTTLAT